MLGIYLDKIIIWKYLNWEGFILSRVKPSFKMTSIIYDKRAQSVPKPFCSLQSLGNLKKYWVSLPIHLLDTSFNCLGYDLGFEICKRSHSVICSKFRIHWISFHATLIVVLQVCFIYFPLSPTIHYKNFHRKKTLKN